MPDFSVVMTTGSGDSKSSAPAVGEITVTKLRDVTSAPLFNQSDFFIADGTSNITDGTSNTSAHTGGVNFGFCDGSVKLGDTAFGSYDLV